MCLTKKSKRGIKRYKRNKIVPVFNKPEENYEYTGSILNEKILCNKCKKIFNSDEMKIHCNGCHKFYHCGIAGRCIGKGCTIGMGSYTHSMGYCLNCVDLKLKINTDLNDKCICNDCKIDYKNT